MTSRYFKDKNMTDFFGRGMWNMNAARVLSTAREMTATEISDLTHWIETPMGQTWWEGKAALASIAEGSVLGYFNRDIQTVCKILVETCDMSPDQLSQFRPFDRAVEIDQEFDLSWTRGEAVLSENIRNKVVIDRLEKSASDYMANHFAHVINDASLNKQSCDDGDDYAGTG